MVAMGHRPRQREGRAAWFALGFLATICQVLLLREFLVVCSGSDLGIALLLATWLFGIAGGATIAVPLVRRHGLPWALLPAAFTALALACPAGLLLMRLFGGLFDAPAGSLAPPEQLLLTALVSVLPAALLAGASFPLACAAVSPASSNRQDGATAVGRIYALEAAGSFTAGLLHTWLLAPGFLPALQVALLAAALLCATATVLPRPPRGGIPPRTRISPWQRTAGVTAVLLMGLGLLPRTGGAIDRWSLERQWFARHPGTEWLETVETPYQRLEAGRFGSQTVLAANGSLIAAVPDPYSATLRGHFLLSVHPSPRRVLIVGGLEQGLATTLLRHPRLDEIRWLEQDPGLPALYRRYAPEEDARALEAPRLAITAADGRRWLARSTQRWDLIAILVPDPASAMLNRYYTREFYADCRRRLAPGGVLLCRITASENYLQGEVGAPARSVFQTLRAVFPSVRAAGGDEVFFAAGGSDGGPGFLTADQLMQHYQESGTADPGFSPLAFHTLVEDERSRLLTAELSRGPDDGRPGILNTDWRPLAQARALRLWSRFSGDGLDPWFGLLLHPIPAGLYWVALALATAWTLAPLARRRTVAGPAKRTVSTAVFVAGFNGLALELLCIHIYQGAFGNLYRMIGSMVALFMLGLALGSAGESRLARMARPPDSVGHRRVLVLSLAGQALVALTAPVLLRLAASGPASFAAAGPPEILVLLLTGAAGLFTGLALPAAAGLLMDSGTSGAGPASARTSGADHLGAAAAAALVGLAVIPRLGIMVGAMLLAMASACCVLRLVLDGTPGKGGTAGT